MAIREVKAYKTSDGQCFPDKAKAYKEEIVQVLSRLDAIKAKGLSVNSLARVLGQVKEWLDFGHDIASTLAAESPDLETGLRQLIDGIEIWVADAEALKAQVDGETDHVVKEAVLET